MNIDNKWSAMETIDPQPMQIDAASTHISVYNLPTKFCHH